MTEEQKANIAWLAAMLLAVLLVVAGCSRVQYIPVETVRTEWRHRIVADSSDAEEKVNIRDSVRIRDSVVRVVDADGNVLRTEVWKWRERYHERDHLLRLWQARYDSLAAVRQDSVQVPVPVERPLTRWQRAKLELGGWAMGAIILMALVIVGWLVYKWRRR